MAGVIARIQDFECKVKWPPKNLVGAKAAESAQVDDANPVLVVKSFA